MEANLSREARSGRSSIYWDLPLSIKDHRKFWIALGANAV